MPVLSLRVDQLADLAFYMARKKCLQLAEPGVGKTPSVAVNQFARWQTNQMRTLWIQPKQLMAKNEREICRFTPFTSLDTAIIDGSPKKVKAALNSGAKVLLVGPDRFRMIADQLPSDIRAVDTDEHHMCFGGPGSSRTLAFYDLARRMEEMVLMTGTLVNGRLDSAYSAIHAIEPLYYPMGYDQFLSEHAILDDYGRPTSWHNHDRIRQILAKHAIYRTFNSVYGNQEIVMEMDWVAMSDRQRVMYDKFEEDAYLELEDFMINGTLPGVATIRARQIMEHPNVFPNLLEEGGPPVDICPGHRPAKLDALEIHFEDHIRTRTPLLTFAFFRPQQREIAALARKMGLRVGMMTGETSGADRDRNDKAFVNGELDLLVASYRVASVGYNWQFSGDRQVNHVINASLGYLDSDVIQGFRRTVRGDRKGIPLRVTTMAYLNSLDTKNMAIIERKSRDANMVEPTREILRFNTHEEVPT